MDAAACAERYQRLIRFGRRLEGCARLAPLLQLVIEQARELLGASRCAVFLVDERTGELRASVTDESGSRAVVLPAGTGLAGAVAASGEPARRPRAAAVPLKDDAGRVFGVFEALDKASGDFDADDEALLQLLAAIAARTIHGALLNAGLRQSYLETVRRLALAAEMRDTEDTAAHLERIGRYSRIIAENLGLPEALVEDIEAVSPLHDIGKIGLPDAVLKKMGKLTPQERLAMQEHPRIGRDILAGARSPLLQLAAEIAWGHHERYDGAGYPRGLAGDALSLPVHAVIVADVFDALTSARVYKPAWDFDEACAFMAAQSGRAFHPRAVESLLNSAARLRRAFS